MAARSTEDWPEISGPAEWFRMNYPPSWRVRSSDSVLEFAPARNSGKTPRSPGVEDEPAVGRSPGAHGIDEADDWTMTVQALWREESVALDSLIDPAALFPRVVSYEDMDVEASGPATVCARRGRSRLLHGVNLLQRVFGKGHYFEWQVWAIRVGPVCLIVGIVSRPGMRLDHVTRTLAATALNSLAFSKSPALPPDAFRRRAIELAKKHYPLVEIRTTSEFRLRLNRSEINLSNFYRSYLQDTTRLDEILLPALTTVVRLQEWGPNQMNPPLHLIRDRIMPMLYSEESDDSMDGLARSAWVAGLTVMYVVDEDMSYRYIHDEQLESWELSLEELHDLALDNLENYSQKNPVEVTLLGTEADPRILMPSTPDAYNSVRMLNRHFHRRLQQVFGPEFLVGVPNRDFFVAVSLNHPDLVGHIRERVAKDFRSMHHPLTERLLVISHDGVSEYCDEETE